MFCFRSEPLCEPHVKLYLYRHSGSPCITGSHYISPLYTSGHSRAIWDASEPYEPLYGPHQDLSSSGCSVSTISPPYVNGMNIQPFNASCVPSELWGHHTSTSCTSSHSGSSSSPVSLGSHYMNHIKIYQFSDVLCPQ